MLGWARQILAAAGHDAELVAVPGDVLPPDMWPTAHHPQHLLADSGKARRLLGWQPAPAQAGLARSVGWHLANPPEDASTDFADDDQALAAAAQAERLFTDLPNRAISSRCGENCSSIRPTPASS